MRHPRTTGCRRTACAATVATLLLAVATLLLAVATLLLAVATVVHAQRAAGELRLRVIDESGLEAEAEGTLEAAALDLRRAFTTDARGRFIADNLPFGVYRLHVTRAGFAPFSDSVEVRTELPIAFTVTLHVAPVQTAVNVSAAPASVLNAFRTGSASFFGTDQLRDRPASGAGRSIVDLVNTQPGWLLEANGVLHPRGSEYQVQYVIDGIPLRDNRSPAFSQLFGVEEFESLAVRTGGYPAEFGGKLGGVIEVNTARDARAGFHGSASAQVGGYRNRGGFFFGQYARGGSRIGLSVEATATDRYLDPPVEANYTNDGDGRGLAVHFDRAWGDSDRTRVYAERHSADFSVPNEALQEQAGQRQSRGSNETLAQVTHQHVFSTHALGHVRFMTRHTDGSLASNALSTPIQPTQDRSLTEAYVNADLALSRGRHEFKLGGEAIWGEVEESFAATITAYRLAGLRIYDRDLPPSFAFADRRRDREQALFAQDVVRFGPATVSIGLRYDHYRLVVDEQAVSPRVSASWALPRADFVVHAAYDRAFQTPSVENVLLSSADLVARLGGEGQSLPLRSSRGHFSEVGVSKAFLDRLRLNATYYYRTATNFADDDLLLNTSVSFPIAFARGRVRGYEATLEAPHWGRAAGAVTYSHSEGEGQLPIAGGLFLGDEVTGLLNSTETFRISQDQRHTVRGRIQFHVTPRVWLAGSAQYNSGLPLEIDGDVNLPFLVQQYGQAIVDRVDFEGGRIRPSGAIDASAGWEIVKGDRRSMRLQADVFNLTDRLNVINFAGLLSGTAIGPRRTWTVRLAAAF